MSRKELEIESTYEALDTDGFSPDERADYETWLDTLDAAPEIIADQNIAFPDANDFSF